MPSRRRPHCHKFAWDKGYTARNALTAADSVRLDRLYLICPRCRGSGRLRTVESRTGAILRRLGSALTLKGFTKVEVRTQPEVVDYLRRAYAQEVHDLQVRHEREVELVAVSDQVDDSVLRYLRADGREVRPGGRRKR